MKSSFFGIVWVAVTLIFLLAIFIRWLCCWRHFKRFLFGLACFVTLIALFYVEEDWRGKHDWEKFKREQEAKGEKFDWQSVVPAPVPDDRNFAFAPIWVESVKALLAPNRWRQWKYPDDGRTNFTDRLLLNTYHQYTSADSDANNPNPGDWQTGKLTDLKNWQIYYRTPSQKTSRDFSTNDFPIATQPQTPAQDVLLALSKYDSAIEELRQAGQLPDSRFPLNYDSENPAIILLPHLAALKRSAMTLQLRAIAELQNGQSEAAFNDVKLMLRLASAVRTEPILISHLVRIAILNMALQPVWEGLAEHKWSDEQLTGLDSELAKLDFLTDYQSVMRGVSAFTTREVDYLQSSRKISTYLDFDGGNHSHGNELLDWMAYALPGGWFHQNQIGLSKFYLQKALPLVDSGHRTVSPKVAEQVDSELEAEIRQRTPYNLIEGIILSPMKTWFNEGYTFVKRFAYGQSSVDMARVAIALERYRLAHGEFPESLDALAPKFIAELPHDVIGGGPLHYRRTADGQFVLYSIGWNERDDGGVVVFKKGSSPREESKTDVDIDQGDWVWKYPAKKE
jgi:hypothetical protein